MHSLLSTQMVCYHSPWLSLYQLNYHQLASLAQRLQRHTPQDHSQRHASRSPIGNEKVRTSGIRNQPWSVRQPPTSSTRTAQFNQRLGQSADHGRAVELVQTLKEMKDLKLKPDILTYNSAMELFGRHAMEDEAWALIEDMKALRILPDMQTFKFLLQVRLISSVSLKTSLESYFQCTGCPSRTTRSYLVRAEIDEGSWHRARRVELCFTHSEISGWPQLGNGIQALSRDGGPGINSHAQNCRGHNHP